MPGHYSSIEHVVSVWQRIDNVLKMILKWICNSLRFLWNALATFQNRLVVLFNAFSMRWKCISIKKPFNAIFVKPAFPKIQSHINNWKHYIFLQLIKNALSQIYSDWLTASISCWITVSGRLQAYLPVSGHNQVHDWDKITQCLTECQQSMKP